MKATVFDQIRAQEKESRRQAISAIAENLLAEKGLAGVTIRNVAEAAGLSTGAIYMYFRNKEEMFVHILVNNLKTLEQNLKTSMTSQNLPDILRSMAEHYKAYYMKIGKYIDLVDLLASNGDDKATISADLMQTLHNQVISIFKWLEEQMVRPEIAKRLKGIPPKRVVPVLWCMITGLSHITLPSARSREGGFDFDQTLEDMVAIIMKSS